MKKELENFVQVHIQPEMGKICRHIDVPELIVRSVPAHAAMAELDGYDLDQSFDEDECEDGSPFGGITKYEDRLQGRLVNKRMHRLCEVKYDLSYFDQAGKFLGLDKNRLIEEDEMDVGDHIPIDMKVNLPDGTSKCVFNVRAKKPGWVSSFFWG